jgi:hypothetical protein
MDQDMGVQMKVTKSELNENTSSFRQISVVYYFCFIRLFCVWFFSFCFIFCFSFSFLFFSSAVLRMLQKIGTVDAIPSFIEKVKSKQIRLMGFGHRVYKNYDPRAKIIRKVAEEVFSILGKEPLIEVAVALEKIALSDPFFIERKLYPNVDFYSGLIYKSMGFPTDYFPVLFLIPRTVGWLAHWSEFTDDPENRIVRPFQVYVGPGKRDYVGINERNSSSSASSSSSNGNNNAVKMNIISELTAESKRRNAAKSDTEYKPE